MWAAGAARADNVKLLCEGRGGPETSRAFAKRNDDGYTALHLAACSSRAGRLATVEALIECGAKVDVRADTRKRSKLTASMVAAQRGDLDMVQRLVACGADLRATDKLDRTLTMLAAMNGHVHVLSYLLRAGVDVNASDSSFNTAVHYAAAYGWVECLDLLVATGAGADARNSWGSTPLDLALKKGCCACVAALLKLSNTAVDVNARDSRTKQTMFTSLVGAYLQELYLNATAEVPWAVTQLLQRPDLNLSAVDSRQRTLLHQIAESTLCRGGPGLAFVSTLLVKGLPPLLRNDEGLTAAEIAMKARNWALLRLLLDYTDHSGIQPQSDGSTLLHNLMSQVADLGEAEFAGLLDRLVGGEWDGAVDAEGRTPMLVAAQQLSQRTKHYCGEHRWNETIRRFELVLSKMPSRVTDVVQRRKGFATWAEVERRMRETDGKARWRPADEYTWHSGQFSLLHILCAVSHVEGATRVCTKIIKSIRDKAELKRLVNLKPPTGDTPVRCVLRQLSENPYAEHALDLLKLLRDAGANMNSIAHPLFDSLEEVRQAEEQAECSLDSLEGTDEAKLTTVRNYIRQRERQRERERLAGPDHNVADLESTMHFFLRIRPSSHLFDSMCVRGLIACGEANAMQVKSTDAKGNTALHVPVNQDRMNVVDALLKRFPTSTDDLQPNSINVNARNHDGQSPLTLAARSGVNYFVLVLLAHGADPNYVCPGSGSALHCAVRAGSLVSIAALLRNNCQINIRDDEGRTALHLAMKQSTASREDCVEASMEGELIAAGADVDARDCRGRSPAVYGFVRAERNLECAFPMVKRHDPIDMLHTLAMAKAKLDVVDDDGRTLLHYAAAAGASICVLSLTDSNHSLVSAQDKDGNSPLAVALLAARWDTATILVSKGSSLAAPVNRIERTQVEMEKEDGSRVMALVETKRSQKSTLWHALSSDGPLTTYLLAVHSFPFETVYLALLHHLKLQRALQHVRQCRDNAEVCARMGSSAKTALHHLVSLRGFDIARNFATAIADALIERGVPVDAQSTEGWTAVHMCAYYGNINLVRQLIQVHRARVDIQDKEGRTAVVSMLIGRAPSAEMLCELLEGRGASADLVDCNVVGSRSRASEEELEAWCDPVARMLPTVNSKSKQQLLERLALQRDQKQETPARAPSPPPADGYTVSSTALIEAVRLRCVRLVNALLSFGADPAGTDDDGRTALHHAVLTKQDTKLCTLLRWSTGSIDAVDKRGYSALGYATLLSLENSEDGLGAVDLLLDFGADVKTGKALSLAIAHNRLCTGRMLLYCATTSVKAATQVPKQRALIGDKVWVRYGGVCRSWHLASVLALEGQMMDVVTENRQDRSTSASYRRCFAVRVKAAWVRQADSRVDVPKRSVSSLVIENMKHNKTAERQRSELYKRRAGAETTLLDQMKPSSPFLHTLFSPLSVGDAVGHISDTENGVRLCMGQVYAVQPNGLVTVQILNGQRLSGVKRVELRAVRQDLVVSSGSRHAGLDETLSCARPLPFASFADPAMTKALTAAGAPLGLRDKKGRPRLDIAVAGRQVKAALQRDIASPDGRSLPVPAHPSPSVATALDVRADAKAAMQALHNESNAQLVVARVSKVCEMEGDGIHVVADGDDDFFDVSLTKVDVQHGQYGTYAFYKMQLLHDPTNGLHVLLTNWGRIGERGKYQQTPVGTQEQGAKEFAKVFRSKTGNAWAGRHAFERKPGKYALVKAVRRHVKHPNRLLANIVNSSTLACRIDSTVAATLRGLLSVEALTAAAQAAGLDQSRMPLAKLSPEMLDAAEAKLKEVIAEVNNASNPSRSYCSNPKELKAYFEKVARLTSELYELLPGRDQEVTPLQKDDCRLGEAAEQIRQLRDLSVTKEILLGAMHRQREMHPLEYAYAALDRRMEPLDPHSTEHACLERTIDATCGESVIVNQIFALSRQQPQCQVGNKRLLFHGSVNANVLGILQQGLRIAPPEAPVSGYMYGKGVYFADDFSKALGYASPMHSGELSRAYVLVAEVSLGTPHLAADAEYMEAPREGTHSTFAPGQTEPDPELTVVLDETGDMVPLGRPRRMPIRRVKSKWTTATWRSDLEEDQALKLEKARLDADTSFPATVRITHQDVEFDMLLEGPFCSESSGTEPKDQQSERARYLSDLYLRREEKNVREKPHSEFIVYNTSQIRLRYLVEVTTPAAVELEWKRLQEKVNNDSSECLV